MNQSILLKGKKVRGRMDMEKGKIIIANIEGIDGTGKSSIINTMCQKIIQE